MVIPTTISKDAPILVRTGGQERFLGKAGRANGKVAVRILEATHPAPPTSTLPSA
jgi:flagellar motor switch protein FliM